jgi:hypothetical protein
MLIAFVRTYCISIFALNWSGGGPIKGTVYRFVVLWEESKQHAIPSRLLTCSVKYWQGARKCCILFALYSTVFYNFLHKGIGDVFITFEISLRLRVFFSVLASYALSYLEHTPLLILGFNGAQLLKLFIFFSYCTVWM